MCKHIFGQSDGRANTIIPASRVNDPVLAAARVQREWRLREVLIVPLNRVIPDGHVRLLVN